MSHQAFLTVLSNQNLRLVFLGQALATIASRFFDIALIWLALGVSQDYNSVGLLIFFRFLPYALLGLIGGWVSDRYNRKNIVFISDMLRAVLLVSLALLLYGKWNALPLLASTAFLLTVARTFFQPAIQGLLPELASRETIGHANAVLHGMNEIAGIVAPVIAGFVLLILPADAFIAITGVLFFVAALCMLFLRTSKITKETEPASFATVRADYRALFQCLAGPQRGVLIAIVVNAIAVLGVGGVLSLLIPAMTKARFSDGPEFFGLLMGVIAFGTVIGAYATAYIVDRHRNSRMYYAWAAYGILIACLGLPLSFSAALGIGLVFGFVGAFADVLFATIIQADMPDQHISKSFALFSTLANCGEALSAPILAAILSMFGLTAAFAVGGGIAAITALIGLFALRSTSIQQRASIR